MRLRLLVVLVLAAGAGADEVRLRDGRVFDGVLVSPAEADPVAIEVSEGRASAVLRFPRDQVAEVKVGASARQQAIAALASRRRAAEAAGDAAALWEVAEGLRRLDQPLAAREVARSVIAFDRHHEAAHALLGLRRHRGIWMRPHEAAMAEGLVLHEGRYLAWSDYQAALAVAEERRARILAEREESARRAAERARQAASAASWDDLPIGLGAAVPVGGLAARRLLWSWGGGSGASSCTTTTTGGGSGGGLWANGGSGSFRWGFSWNW